MFWARPSEVRNSNRGDIWRPYAESRVTGYDLAKRGRYLAAVCRVACCGYDLAARGPQWLQESVSGEGELTEALEKLLGNAGASLGN